MLGFDLAVGLLLLLGFLQGLELVLSQDQALLGHLRFQRLESLLEGLQIMPQPDRAHPAGRDEEALSLQLVRDAKLPIGRLLEGKPNNGLFDLGRHTVLDDGFLRLISRRAISPPWS